MPRYDFECPKCHRKFELYRSLSDFSRDEPCIFCHKTAVLVPSIPSLHTDSNFVGTGEYDNRLCVNRDDKIEGRKDWAHRLEKKNLRELDRSEVTKNPSVPKPCM